MPSIRLQFFFWGSVIFSPLYTSLSHLQLIFTEIWPKKKITNQVQIIPVSSALQNILFKKTAIVGTYLRTSCAMCTHIIIKTIELGDQTNTCGPKDFKSSVFEIVLFYTHSLLIYRLVLSGCFLQTAELLNRYKSISTIFYIRLKTLFWMVVWKYLIRVFSFRVLIIAVQFTDDSIKRWWITVYEIIDTVDISYMAFV